LLQFPLQGFRVIISPVSFKANLSATKLVLQKLAKLSHFK